MLAAVDRCVAGRAARGCGQGKGGGNAMGELGQGRGSGVCPPPLAAHPPCPVGGGGVDRCGQALRWQSKEGSLLGCAGQVSAGLCNELRGEKLLKGLGTGSKGAWGAGERGAQPWHYRQPPSPLPSSLSVPHGRLGRTQPWDAWLS